VFYLAFLPQFVSPGAGSPATTIFALGCAFAALTFAVKGPVGLTAGRQRRASPSRPVRTAWRSLSFTSIRSRKRS